MEEKDLREFQRSFKDQQLELLRMVMHRVNNTSFTWAEVVNAYGMCCDAMEWPHGVEE